MPAPLFWLNPPEAPGWRARALAPRNPSLLTALGGIAERSERLEQAIAFYREIPENSAYRRTAELQIGLDLWYSDQKEEAKAHLERAVRSYPDDPKAHTALADVLAAGKDYAPAAKALDKAIELTEATGEASWNLYYQRGIAFERTDQWDKAEKDFRKALELSPDQPQVLNYLGYSLVEKQQNLDEALEMGEVVVAVFIGTGWMDVGHGVGHAVSKHILEILEQLLVGLLGGQ